MKSTSIYNGNYIKGFTNSLTKKITRSLAIVLGADVNRLYK
jgi:hypothetical protein